VTLARTPGIVSNAARANEERAMEFPDDLKYTREHEWLLVEDKVATVGITDFAQEQLGDVVFVELPAVGDKVTKDEAMGVIESVKAVSDVYAPVSGKVLEVNDDLPENTEMVNEDPYGDGWMVKIEISDPSEIADLLSAAEYEQFVSEQEE
jgi:glycine cleavage system H protein